MDTGKQKCEYVLLILNCAKYRNKAVTQKNTWLRTLPDFIQYFHVLGNPNLEIPFLFDWNEKILHVKVPDDYLSLPKKTISALEAIHHTFDYKYIFKTDDDQMLTIPTFFDTMRNILNTKSPHYGGNVVNIAKPQFSDYHLVHPEVPKSSILKPTLYCSGRFYFLSPEAVQCVVTKKEKIQKEVFEDYAIGFYLDADLKTNIYFIPTSSYFVDMENAPKVKMAYPPNTSGKKISMTLL